MCIIFHGSREVRKICSLSLNCYRIRAWRFYSDKEQIDTSTPTGKLMLTMIAAIAEFEHQTLLDRQREGIAIARQKGA